MNKNKIIIYTIILAIIFIFTVYFFTPKTYTMCGSALPAVCQTCKCSMGIPFSPNSFGGNDIDCFMGKLLKCDQGQSATNVEQTTNNETNEEPSIPSEWETYTSKSYEFSIKIPKDWKNLMPADGTLSPLSDNIFEVYTLISSPDKKEKILFMNKPLIFDETKCEKSAKELNGNKVNEITCPNSNDDEIPGKLNYEFAEKNLIISLNEKTDTIEKIISFII